MNPLGAFSFGKIIKTFIPGVVALGLPLFLFEALYFSELADSRLAAREAFWSFFLRNSFFFGQSQHDAPLSVAAISLLLLPLALIMGFLLNTVFWLFFHNFCWDCAKGKQVEGRLHRSVVKFTSCRVDDTYRELRQQLEALARAGLDTTFPNLQAKPKKIHLPGFFLPMIDINKLGFLRESYFSWYEFQLNSVFAMILSFAGFSVLWFQIMMRWGCRQSWLTFIFLIVVVGFGSYILSVAAMKNLKLFQERTLWFYLGCLVFASPDYVIQNLLEYTRQKPAIKPPDA